MPSGRTHDAVTFLLAAPMAYAAWRFGAGAAGAAVAATSFTFAGLMFAGDLDTKSVQYYRWGPLRFIWAPYQWFVPHRSALSHGLVVGPFVRLLYLTAIALGVVALARFGATGAWPSWQHLADVLVGWSVVATDDPAAVYMGPLLAGLWLGGASHSLADWGWSAVKRGSRAPIK